MTANKPLIALAIVVGSAICMTTPAKDTASDRMSYTKRIETTKSGGAPNRTSKSHASSECPIAYLDFQDDRPNKETVGVRFVSSLQPDGLADWLKAAQQDLWSSNRAGGNGGTVTITIQPKLYRLYSYAQGMNIHGVLALSVDFIVDGKVVDSKRFRGFGSTMNGWNAEHEYYQALSYAAQDAFPKVLDYASTLCSKFEHPKATK